VFVQIYGITTTEDAIAVDRLEPDSIGLVLDEGIDTWDSVGADAARRIREAVTRSRVVALSLSTDPARVLATAEALEPDIVHMARADGMEPRVLDSIRSSIAPAQLMLTVPVHGADALSLAERMAASADYVLLDTRHPETGIVGATGRTHDWTVSAGIVRALETPVVLAGGLGPQNVLEAIAAVRPFGVDSETRTSRDADRRRKDMGKVEEFIALARAG
jgi:phosphoribosylanthranilate isomerase